MTRTVPSGSNAIDSSLAGTLWITVRSSTAGGRRGRDYEVSDGTGAVRLTARADVWGRELPVHADGQRVLLLRRRRLFPLTGRVDILSPSGAVLGAVHRSGRVADARGHELARFRDARTLRERAGEGVLQAVFDAALGGEGAATGASPTGYVCVAAGSAIGTLAIRRLPFAHAQEPSARATLVGRLLPERARQAVRAATAPRGWRLSFEERIDGADPLLLTGAALFMVELSQW